MRDKFNIQRDYERWKWPQNITLGYSSLKSLEILGVHSRRAKIFAAISFPWKYDNLQILSGSRIFKALICYVHSYSSTAFDFFSNLWLNFTLKLNKIWTLQLNVMFHK